MKLYCIKTEKCVYVSWGETPYPKDFGYEDYLFDGEHPEKTYKKEWVKIKQMPTLVQKLVLGKEELAGFKLKEGFPITERTPEKLKPVSSWETDDDDYSVFPEEYFEFRALYEDIVNITNSHWETIEVEPVVLAELKDFEIVSVNYDVKHRLIDEIDTHPILLQEKPCSLTSEESFKIIRQHIKLNIDPKVAEMSDYDFCLTVHKHVELIEPMKMVPLFSKSKNPKPTYRKHDGWQVFETAPDRARDGVYKGHTRTPEFKGKNLKDLQKNIETFLSDLMKMINQPVKECPCCNGIGVVEVSNV